MAAAGEDCSDRAGPQPRHPQQQFARGAVDIDRKAFAEFQRPGQLGIHVERQHPVRARRLLHFIWTIAIEPHQPVRLIEPVFPDQGRTFERQDRAGIGNRAEGRVIDPTQAVLPVKRAGPAHDLGIACPVRADDHLGRLPGRSKARSRTEAPPRVLRLDNRAFEIAHRAFDHSRVLVWRQPGQPGNGGQFDIDRNAVGIESGLPDQFRISLRNGLKMNISPEIMLLTKNPRNLYELLHGVAGAFDDAGGEEQPFDVIAAIETERQVHHFLRREPRAPHVRAFAVDAVMAIEHAVVGQQDLEQRDAAAIRGIGVADAHALGRADPLAALAGAAAGAG